MELSCSCSTDYEECAWYYSKALEENPLGTKTRRRCQSCEAFIEKGSLCIEFMRWRDVENVWGGMTGEQSLASYYECEECSDLRESLEELGYCIQLGEDVRELVKEYAALHKKSLKTE